MTDASGPVGMPSAWGVRLALATRGWISSARLMHGPGPREPFFQIWFSRWDWHGRNCDRVTLHSGCAAPLGDEAGALRDMEACVRRAAARALDAWDRFPDSVPQQEADGGLREEPVGTRAIFREGWRAADHRPTERLPADMAPYCGGRGDGDATLAAALRLASDGMDYEDDLSWMWRTSGERRTDRIWGLDYRVTARSWHGERLTPNRLKFGCDALAESLVALSIDGTRGALARMAEIYRPGGPMGDLPPGFERLSDRILAGEAERRAKDARGSVRLGMHADEPVEEAARLLGQWTGRWRSSRTLRERLPEPTLGDVAAALGAAAAEAGRGPQAQPPPA